MSLPLTMMLRPPGCGLHSPSLGTNPSAADLLSTMYGTHDPNRIEAAWRDSLRAIPNARILLLGVPSDTGAGGRRGAAYGPIGVREALYAGPRITNLIDVGDICCVPHLLHDDMLNGAQLGNTRAALYGSADAPYPASPLSIVAAVCSELRRLAPTALILTIGGDHSISACTIGGVVPDSITRWGLLHFDAHADRSKSRFGVALTYGSWLPYLEARREVPAIAQIGLDDLQPRIKRANTMQIGCSEVVQRGVDGCANEIVEWFNSRGVDQLYLTIDADVTTMDEAPAVALPATTGLRAEEVTRIVEIVRLSLRILGGDVVEVAPVLASRGPWSEDPTCRVAAGYVRAMLGLTRRQA